MMKKLAMLYGTVFVVLSLTIISGCGESQKAQPASPPQAEAVPQPAPVPQAPATKPVDPSEKAAKQLEFAAQYMASAQKGIMPYAQAVAICRNVIQNNPGTPYEDQARQLLRQVPEDQRSRFALTDEELGL